MPRYRKLYVKSVESLDLNEMPDSDCRLLWVFLPGALCREGRGLDNPAWIKSKVFPLRLDLTLDNIQNYMDWFDKRGMIVRYEVSGRKYFLVPTFHKYQGDTQKEAESNYPSPIDDVAQELVQNKSRVSPDKDMTLLNHTESESESESVFESESEVESTAELPLQNHPGVDLSAKFVELTSIPEFTPSPRSWTESLDKLLKAGVEPEDIETAVLELRDSKTDYNIVGLRSIITPAINAMSKRKGNKRKIKSGNDYVTGELAQHVKH